MWCVLLYCLHIILQLLQDLIIDVALLILFTRQLSVSLNWFSLFAQQQCCQYCWKSDVCTGLFWCESVKVGFSTRSKLKSMWANLEFSYFYCNATKFSCFLVPFSFVSLGFDWYAWVCVWFVRAQVKKNLLSFFKAVCWTFCGSFKAVCCQPMMDG